MQEKIFMTILGGYMKDVEVKLRVTLMPWKAGKRRTVGNRRPPGNREMAVFHEA